MSRERVQCARGADAWGGAWEGVGRVKRSRRMCATHLQRHEARLHLHDGGAQVAHQALLLKRSTNVCLVLRVAHCELSPGTGVGGERGALRQCAFPPDDAPSACSSTPREHDWRVECFPCSWCLKRARVRPARAPTCQGGLRLVEPGCFAGAEGCTPHKPQCVPATNGCRPGTAGGPV